ncbi:GntR family transcriptional regulator [Testudinibacter aquarius]|uniref:GntR family transcriptional regulator n=1 Tax=Testudinibacter aquarius TaxID=1524974 RepID=A0A4R3YD90_9PAST|nr:GntR family transcriptional regulator [Testudinibacter aquarius]KAE9525844.1 hypothetical protein A1D24_03550 [Testudinibacter aquarius]TCV88784.1 GntR family transcriptional regulator [Testudinibacter aquarius]
MLPKYEKIKRDIIADIENSIFLPGDKIYSENNLKQKYNASNTTVVKALNDLVSDGYVIRRQGIGTFVRRNIRHKKVLLSEISPLHSHSTSIEKTETTVLPASQNPVISIKLGSKNGLEPVIKIIQTSLLNDKIWKIQNRYILAHRLSPEMIEHIQQGASLSDELHLESNMANLPMKMQIKAVKLPADIAETQEISKGEEITLIKIERLIYNLERSPIEFSESFICPEHYAIEVISE